MCFAWISEQTAIFSLYSINLSVFITEAGSVFCAVQTGSLNQIDTVSYLKGYLSNTTACTQSLGGFEVFRHKFRCEGPFKKHLMKERKGLN